MGLPRDQERANQHLSEREQVFFLNFQSKFHTLLPKLIEKNETLVKAVDGFGRTGLHHAVIYKRLEVAERLLDYISRDPKHSTLNYHDIFGLTPLHYAVLFNEINFVKMLLKTEGVQIDATQKVLLRKSRKYRSNPETPLYFAVLAGNLEMTKLLLESGAKATVVDRSGKTLYEHARMSGNSELMELFSSFLPLQEDAVLLRQEDDILFSGDTPLHSAVRAGDLERVRFLMIGSADPLQKNEAEETPIMLAWQLRHSQIFHYLVGYLEQNIALEEFKNTVSKDEEMYFFTPYKDMRELQIMDSLPSWILENEKQVTNELLNEERVAVRSNR